MHPSATTLRFVAVAAFAANVSHSFTVPSERATPSRPGATSPSKSQRFVAAATPPEALVVLDQSAPAAAAVVPLDDQQDFSLSKEESQPIIRIGSGEKEKIINAFGLWCAFVSIITGPIWAFAMWLVDVTIHQQQQQQENGENSSMDPHRAIFDGTGKVWSKVWLTMTGCYPTITGNLQHNAKEFNTTTACLYVANHASWLDIPVLCTVLDPVFKFIAKGELANVPCIGQQLHGGRHILIDREDRKSQLATFKQGIGYLRKGVPLMAFPEGKRSPDGRLMEFKRGLFSLATKAQVPIIPITICNTAAVMPSYSYFPVQAGNGRIRVHIGEPIHPQGKTELELEALVRAAFMDQLPLCQHPIRPPAEAAVPVHQQREPQTV